MAKGAGAVNSRMSRLDIKKREHLWLLAFSALLLIFGLIHLGGSWGLCGGQIGVGQSPWSSDVLKSRTTSTQTDNKIRLESQLTANNNEFAPSNVSSTSDLFGPWDYNRTLYISPYTGLANTLQAIASAFTAARKEHFNVKIVFNPGSQQFGPACWESLFDEPKIGQFNSTYPDGALFDRDTKSCKVHPPISRWDVMNMDWEKHGEHSEILCVSVCCWQEPPFPESLRWFFDMMTPAPDLKEIIDSFKKSVEWNKYQWVGVHFRRSDNMEAMRNLIKNGPMKDRVNHTSINDDDILPISSYIDRMEDFRKDISTHDLGYHQIVKPLRFFLATDNPKATRQVVTSFPQGMVVYFEKEDLPQIRSSVSGMQSAIIDLFLLASCDALIGTPYSTFSATASYMGKKLYVEPEFKYATWSRLPKWVCP